MTKQNFRLGLVLLILFSLLPGMSPAETLVQPLNEPLHGFLRIHYHRTDGNYDNFALWLWDEVKQPSTDWPKGATRFSGRSPSGAYADIPLLDNASQVGVLIINLATEQKEGGSKVIKLKEGQNQVWVRENDDVIYPSADLEVAVELLSATIIDEGKVSLTFNTIADLQLSELPGQISLHDSENGMASITAVATASVNQIVIDAAISLAKLPLRLDFAGKSIFANLSWKLIDRLYAYEGNDLGCTMENGSATLKLWAPLAQKVELLVFAANDQTVQVGQKNMVRGEHGVWSCVLEPGQFKGMTDLQGYFYQYVVTNPGLAPKRVLDPYAKSMAAVTVDCAGQSAGSSGDLVGKAAIVAPEKIGKPGKAPRIEGFNKREDAIIYEVHIRDFTSDPSIEGELKSRWGSYRAFIDKLPYIKSLGVTHVQLLPVQAWYFGDETKMGERELEYSSRKNNYNWGYDPQNYFSLDGAYSENPENPQLRIAEFKDLVNAIHEAGMGVILDVVYTHMAQASFLNDIVPDYYFFKDQQGAFLGDFGNNLATNRKMSVRLMIDSVKYWFSEYKIDGMRWDMMGDATHDAVQRAFNEAAAINPQTIFIGEGWRTFKGHLEDPALAGMGADQDWMAKTDSVGVFSDEMRNELKSGFGCEGAPMFLSGGPRMINKLFANIKAQPTNTPADSPGDMVQYIEAHDNLPLYDVLAQSIQKDPEIPENDREIHRRIRLGNLIILTSQGTAFLHAGQEFGRTKQWKAVSTPEQKFHVLTDSSGKPFKHPYFIHDSYDSSDAINMFDWSKATDAQKFPVNLQTASYTRGLIALRKSTDAFRLGSRELVDKNVTLLSAPEIRNEDLVIAYWCEATDGNRYYIFVNSDSKEREITLSNDLSSGKVLVDASSAGTLPITSPQGFKMTATSIKIEPLTGVIINLPGKNP